MTNDKARDYSKIDGISNNVWDLAEILYSARIKAAWGNSKESNPPKREGYSHGKQVADFDLAIASAKEAINKGYKL